MNKRVGCVLATGLAMVLVAGLVAPAAARQFKIVTPRPITLTSSGAITYAFTEEPETDVSCRLTLRGHLDFPIEEVSGERAGTIEEVSAEECRNGSVTIGGLPVSMTFQALLGTAPEAVTGLEVMVSAYIRLIEEGLLFFRRCRYQGLMRMLIALTHVSGHNYTTGEVSLVGARTLTLIDETLNRSIVPCWDGADLQGRFTMSPTLTVEQS